MQNGLEELWSLLNFLLPDIFDCTDAFMDWHAHSDCTLHLLRWRRERCVTVTDRC